MIESNRPANFETPPIGASDQTDKQGSTAEKTKAVVEKNHITPNRQEAAKIIEKAWKGHQAIVKIRRESIKPTGPQWKAGEGRQKDMIMGPIVSGPHGPKSEIPIATIEKVIDRLVAVNNGEGDREGLRRLANILFTGPIPYRTMQIRLHDAPSVQALIYLFDNPKADLQSVKKLFIEGLKEWRSGPDKRAYADSEEAAKRKQVRLGINPDVDNYAERTEEFYKNNPEQWIDPDQWIEITHGGGELHIRGFLDGETTAGYPLERGGIGLQVSPKSRETESRSILDYAPKAASYFDRGAVLSAKIQAKYLKAAPNLYEAGLPASSIGHLKDIKMTVLSTGHVWTKTEKGWIEYCEDHFNDQKLGSEVYKSQQIVRGE